MTAPAPPPPLPRPALDSHTHLELCEPPDAELVASAVGIGARMNLAQSTFRIDQVLAWTFFLVILNLLLQAFVSRLEKVFLKWRAEVTVR